MPSQTRSIPARAAFLGCALVVAACSDQAQPVGPPLTTDPPPLEATRIDCRASVRDQKVTCAQAGLAGGASALIVGNQGVYVQVTTSGESYTVGTGDFEFDVTVQNLIPQAMATTDGATPTAEGVRLFFQQAPTVTSGVGVITVAEDGTGTFTAAGQEYFQYSGAELGGDGILSTNETSSAQNWVFNFPATVLTFDFTLFVAADVQFPNGYIDVTPGVDSIVAGGAQALTGTVRSAVGNVIPGQVITWGTGNAGVATVDGSGNVTAVAPGTATITATSGARSGSASIAVCPNLAVGAAYTATSGSFCLGGLAGGAEYTVVPISLGTTASLAYSLTGSGIVPVSGPPTPDLLSAASGTLQGRRRPLDDGALHMSMLRRQRDGAAAMRTRQLVPRPGAGGPRLNITPGVPVVGATMSLNVGQSYCTPLDSRTATVRSVGTRIIIMEDNSNPAGGPSIAQYDHIAATFDSLVYPAVAGNFGAPFDIDTNSRVIALYTAAVNDLTPPASSSFVGGFFYSRDLFSTASCAGSNQGEMFYMLAADPTGVHGNVRSVAFILANTIGTLGHEFEHLINASRRLYGAGGPHPFEQVWLDEGLAHIAEEHVYYASSVHGPGENLDIADLTASPAQTDAFFAFAESNFGRLRQWLLRPDTAGPFKENDGLAVRGAIWSFLRYAADRNGGLESTLWSNLAFSPDTGLTNLASGLGTDPKPWFRDWAAAMYLDDAGAGSPAAIHTQPSWNFRDIYSGLDYDPGPACSCAYQLTVRNPTNGVADSFSLSRSGAASYLRLGVAAGEFAGVTTTAPGANLAITVVRRE